MKKPKHIIKLIFVILAMVTLISHTDITIDYGNEAILLCIKAVIPSLLPLMIFSIYLSYQLPCRNNTFFIIGLLSGYPVGAQNIAEQFKKQRISAQTANRLLMYCSNAGPAFIIGMTANMFSTWYTPFILWGIHILSALAVSIFIAKPKKPDFCSTESRHINFTAAVEKTARSLAIVCCWIIFFRIICGIILKYIESHIPCDLSALIIGMIELANGITYIQSIPGEGLRFIMCAGLLAFGGICVIMQTSTVIKPLSVMPYIVGKIIQAVISVLIACALLPIIFSA